MIYDEIAAAPDERRIEMAALLREEAVRLFSEWNEKPDKIEY